MTPEQQKQLTEIHHFLLAPRGPNQPSRAEEIDEALNAVKAGKFGARAVLWSAGFIAAMGAAWTAIKGGFQ